ncbi:hypothetical protein [Candidatus Mycoplasma haematohominis]|uniref:hypothetical protein n=1 Tax=Candidatus Mycoplasma haematohominis TaxID=1494318 RepID=UPI001C0A74EB|nr:hypothetical protein [Candidatus Mycoplasma haemohominis]
MSIKKKKYKNWKNRNSQLDKDLLLLEKKAAANKFHKPTTNELENLCKQWTGKPEDKSKYLEFVNKIIKTHLKDSNFDAISCEASNNPQI